MEKTALAVVFFFLDLFFFHNERHVKLQELYVTNMMSNLKFALCGLMRFHDDGSEHVS